MKLPSFGVTISLTSRFCMHLASPEAVSRLFHEAITMRGGDLCARKTVDQSGPARRSRSVAR